MMQAGKMEQWRKKKPARRYADGWRRNKSLPTCFWKCNGGMNTIFSTKLYSPLVYWWLRVLSNTLPLVLKCVDYRWLRMPQHIIYIIFIFKPFSVLSYTVDGAGSPGRDNSHQDGNVSSEDKGNQPGSLDCFAVTLPSKIIPGKCPPA